MKELEPIVTPKTLSKPLADAIRQFIRKYFFDELMKDLKPELENAAPAQSKLLRAIERRTVRYVDGVFVGKFEAAISKELKELGARYSRSRKGYEIALTQLPAPMQSKVERILKEQTKLETKLTQSLNKATKRVADEMMAFDFDRYADMTEEFIDERFDRLSDRLAVTPRLDTTQLDELRKSYTDNVRLSISGFVDSEVQTFRRKLMPEIKAGVGRARIFEFVQSRLKVSDNRAAFIARQETALFTSKQKEVQYKGLGIRTYRWKAIGGRRGDGRTRESHMEAHGKIFYFDKPVGPNGDRKPKDTDGKYKNAGEPFGCRCQMIPIVDEI